MCAYVNSFDVSLCDKTIYSFNCETIIVFHLIALSNSQPENLAKAADITKKDAYLVDDFKQNRATIEAKIKKDKQFNCEIYRISYCFTPIKSMDEKQTHQRTCFKYIDCNALFMAHRQSVVDFIDNI